jgi:hypothetical protein
MGEHNIKSMKTKSKNRPLDTNTLKLLGQGPIATTKGK